jgi:hypothetical protein
MLGMGSGEWVGMGGRSGRRLLWRIEIGMENAGAGEGGGVERGEGTGGEAVVLLHYNCPLAVL